MPSKWEKGLLGQLCSIEIGGTPSRNVPSYWDSDRSTVNLWVSIKDLNQKVVRQTLEQITELGIKHSNVKLQGPGTILLSFKLTIGRVSIAGRPLYTNEAIAGLRSDDIEHDFLFHGLQQWDLLQGVDQAIKGATLNKEKLRKIEFIYPTDKPEQSKIAEVLSKVDQAIEQTESLIAKQQRIKTGLMQDLLTRGIDEHGNLRSEETHEFKDSPLGRIPVEWVCSLLSYFVPSAEYGISTSLGDFGTPVLRMNNFSEGEADVSDLKYTELMPPEKLWLRNGDVLFNRTNSWEHVGRTGIWRCQIEKATFASYLVRLNPDPDKLLSEMLNIWLNWEPTQIAMRRAATPAVQQVNINPTNLRSIYAAFPTCLNEQGEIEKRLACLRKTISSNVEGLAKLRSLKTALMQDLLTGKKRVTPLLEKTEVHS